MLAVARGEPVPQGADVAWSIAGGFTGMVGITALYRGLAVGRMGVVAPTTGVLAAVIPVLVGFVLQGLPRGEAIAGIATALVAVVLVTRAPGHGDGRPSGVEWALLASASIGAFDVCVGQLSHAGAFGPLVIMRLVQAVVVVVLIRAWSQPWRIDRRVLLRVAGVGLLDMAGNGAFIVATQSGQFAIAVILSSLYPVVTVVLAIALLRERMTRSHLAGIVLTGIAVTLIAAGNAAG